MSATIAARSATPLVSIVVPTLDDERSVGACLEALERQAPPCEVIVTDGGSTDWTREIAAAAGARVVSGPPGPGRQLALGAAAARGDVLLFVPPEARLPEGALHRVRDAVADGVAWGAIRERSAASGPAAAAAWIAEAWRWLARGPHGDRVMFTTREAYRRCGGFHGLPAVAAPDLAASLRKCGLRSARLPWSWPEASLLRRAIARRQATS